MFFNKKRNNKIKVYCTNCKRASFYINDKYDAVDLCEIPDCGLPFHNRFEYKIQKEDINFDTARGIFTNYTKIVDKEGQKFIKRYLSRIKTSSIENGTIEGIPSELNKNNDCYFYHQK